MYDISLGLYFIFTNFFKTEFLYLKSCEESGRIIVAAGKVGRDLK